MNDGLYSIDDLDTVADEKYYEAIGMANTFDSMIGQLPDLENINSSYEQAVKQIREMYDGLTSYEQQFIDKDSLTKLENYEKKIAELSPAEEEEQTESATENVEETDAEEAV